MEFITADEKKQLQKKLDDLKARRPEIIQRIAEARALGDLKENAEYHSAREEQGYVEAEVRRLEERIKTAKVADNVDIPEGMVFLGAVVKLRDAESGEEENYKLVGESSGSFNFDADYIEVTASSPIGEADEIARGRNRASRFAARCATFRDRRNPLNLIFVALKKHTHDEQVFYCAENQMITPASGSTSSTSLSRLYFLDNSIGNTAPWL